MRLMNLDALVAKGCPPWLPHSDAHDLDVWWMHNIPHVGTFVRGDATVLFTNVGDPDTDTGISVWAYTCLTAIETAKTDHGSFADVEALHQWVDAFFCDRHAVLAVAEDHRVHLWDQCEITDDLHTAAIGFLDAIVAGLRKIKTHRQRELVSA